MPVSVVRTIYCKRIGRCNHTYGWRAGVECTAVTRLHGVLVQVCRCIVSSFRALMVCLQRDRKPLPCPAPRPRFCLRGPTRGRGPSWRRLSDSRLGRALPRLSADSPRYPSAPLAPRLELHRRRGGSEIIRSIFFRPHEDLSSICRVSESLDPRFSSNPRKCYDCSIRVGFTFAPAPTTRYSSIGPISISHR